MTMKMGFLTRAQKNQTAATSGKLVALAITLFVVAEILVLLVAPLAIFTVLSPEPEQYGHGSYHLTDSQIRASWPNLRSAQEIVGSGVYASFDATGLIVLPNSTANIIYYQSKPRYWDNFSATFLIENRTETNVPSSMGLVPRVYQIYLQVNETQWIMVPQTDLVNTSHPPVLPSDPKTGFLGTDMPTVYGVVGVAIVSVTVATAAGYLVWVRRKKRVYAE